ncbi:MAG: adenylyl-sulfate kinase [Desulfovibrio sp.]|jgi:adenylyl-sulfate kinase
MTRFATGIYWFTGLSGAGKTTLTQGVAELLRSQGHTCLVLDGDILRAGLSSDLGFSPEDRRENIRRASEVARMAAQQNQVCLCAFITPYQATRDALRQRLEGLYHEIFVKCPLERCMERDPKQNYFRARQRGANDYTGLGAPYESPVSPNLCVETDRHPIDVCVKMIAEYILESQNKPNGE